MSSSRRPLVAANWKMNKTSEETASFLQGLTESLAAAPGSSSVEVVVAPAATCLDAARRTLADSNVIALASQNCHWDESGAHTGELSSTMLREFGVSHAILGHSERRAMYGETDEGVSKRAARVIADGMTAIVCVGEQESDYRAGESVSVVREQLEGSLDGLTTDDCGRLVIAYEPVWAIGTGLAATPEIAGEMHAEVRSFLEGLFGAESGQSIRILYGGSVKPDNAAQLMAVKDIDGALVGGASLELNSFFGIIQAAVGA